MPKPFSITIDVEESAVGPVFRLLNRTPGVVKLHLDLDHDKPPSVKKNGEMRKPYTRSDKSAKREQLYKLIGNRKSVPREEIEKMYNPHDDVKLRTTIRNVLYNAERQGFLKRPSKGNFALTEKGKSRLAEME